MSKENKDIDSNFSENNHDIRKSLDLDEEAIIIKRETKSFGDFSETYKNYRNSILIKSKKRSSINVLNASNDTITYENKHCLIAICQDGKFVATFDTGKFIISYPLLQLNNFSVNPFF
jgi:hypothetical protein